MSHRNRILGLALLLGAIAGRGWASGPGVLHFDESTIAAGSGAAAVTVHVERSSGSDGAVSVAYAASAGTAVAGQDFDATSGTLSWASGDETVKSFSVTLHPSAGSAGKTILLALSAPTGGATLDSLRSHSTIVLGGDDHPGEHPGAGILKFDERTYDALASTGLAVISVEREEGSQGAVSVHYATGDGTAVAPTDYAATSGTLSWGDGDLAAKTFTVALVVPSAPGPAKTVELTLSAPTGGAALDSDRAQATLVIENDDDQAPPAGGAGLIGFDEPQTSAIEGSGVVTVRVERSEGEHGAVAVGFETSDGTAVSGTDYQAASGTLSWAAGQDGVKTFQVHLLSNPASSGNRTVNLTLHDPTGGAALAPSRATAQIVILDRNGDTSACQTSDDTLCLMGGRFRARISWRINGAAGAGHAARLSDQSGTFSFFDPSNVEMLVKMVDACAPPFHRYWVFYSATTNVGFTLEVTDTHSGVVRQYSNPYGLKAESENDTRSFATCP